MAKKNKELSYKQAVEEIEEILSKIQSDELDIDELAENVKRASELIKFCKTKLKNTEAEVDAILKNMEEN